MVEIQRKLKEHWEGKRTIRIGCSFDKGGMVTTADMTEQEFLLVSGILSRLNARNAPTFSMTDVSGEDND